MRLVLGWTAANKDTHLVSDDRVLGHACTLEGLKGAFQQKPLLRIHCWWSILSVLVFSFIVEPYLHPRSACEGHLLAITSFSVREKKGASNAAKSSSRK